MTGCIGLLILLGIVILIAVLGMKTRKDAVQTAEFYSAHNLGLVTEIPSAIYKAIGADKVYSRQGMLKLTKTGEEISFYWCEWSIQSMSSSGNSRYIASAYYYAVAFAPDTVSAEFMQLAIAATDTSGNAISQKAKDLFVLNTQTPISAEKLSDGGFIIKWRAQKLAEDYERTYLWLQNNITTPHPETPDLPAHSFPEEPIMPAQNEAPAVPENKEEILQMAEIQRFPFRQFLEELPPIEQVQGYNILNLMESMIADYHDTKGHPSLSLEDHAKYLELSLAEVAAASRAVTEIEFPVDIYLAKGFCIPELINYDYGLAYRLEFPSRTLVYLDRTQIFLDDSEPLKIYAR